MFDFAKEVQTIVKYMKGHLSKVMLTLLLNFKADHYASKSQKVMNSIHPAPILTFYMDESRGVEDQRSGYYAPMRI